MSTIQLIEKEIASLPESQQREVYDFARFLRIKTQDEHFDSLLVSEAVLARDGMHLGRMKHGQACSRRCRGAALASAWRFTSPPDPLTVFA